jgi:Flp pilus assembly protein TadG
VDLDLIESHGREGPLGIQRRPSRREDEGGAALVEFVLLVPLLLILLLGIVSAGSLYNRKLDMVTAAREGARYGATIPQQQCTPATKCNNKTWAELVRSIVVARSSGGVTSGQVCVALVKNAPGAPVDATFTTNSDGTRCYDDGDGDTGLRVQVRIVRTGDAINAAFFRVPVSLQSSATAKLEQ